MRVSWYRFRVACSGLLVAGSGLLVSVSGFRLIQAASCRFLGAGFEFWDFLLQYTVSGFRVACCVTSCWVLSAGGLVGWSCCSIRVASCWFVDKTCRVRAWGFGFVFNGARCGSKNLWLLVYGWKIKNSSLPEEWIEGYGRQVKSVKLPVAGKASRVICVGRCYDI